MDHYQVGVDISFKTSKLPNKTNCSISFTSKAFFKKAKPFLCVWDFTLSLKHDCRVIWLHQLFWYNSYSGIRVENCHILPLKIKYDIATTKNICLPQFCIYEYSNPCSLVCLISRINKDWFNWLFWGVWFCKGQPKCRNNFQFQISGRRMHL